MLNIAFINSYVICVTITLKSNKKPLSRHEYLKTALKISGATHARRLQIPTLQTGLRDSKTAFLNMPGSSSSTSTHETDQREDLVSLTIAKNRKFCPIDWQLTND